MTIPGSCSIFLGFVALLHNHLQSWLSRNWSERELKGWSRWRDREKGASHLLPKSEVHRLRVSLFIYREDRSHVGHSEIACATTYYPLILISRMDPLKSLFEKPALTGRTTKWQMLLSESDIKFMTRKAIKGQAVAESPLPAYEPMQLEFSLLSVFFHYW